MSGVRLVIGFLVMGIAVPLTLCFLLDLHRPTDLITIATVTFLTWGVADFFAKILEHPRLKDRSPGRAIKEDWERRSSE